MLDHLDDPTPFDPDDGFRTAVDRRARGLRRRRRLTVTSVTAAIALTAVGASGLYVQRRDAAIDRIDVTSQPSLDGAVNVLVVGTDARPEVEGERADTLIVVRFRPDGTVGLLPLPRDLATGAGADLAQAYARGLQGVVDGVVAATGLPVDHVAALDLDGFADIVDELGGIRLRTETALVDPHSGLSIDGPGCHTLDGRQALALVRARQITYDDADGAPVLDLTGDLGRSVRTQAVVEIAIRQLATVGQDPSTLDHLSRVLADHAALDDGLTLRTLVDLARRLASAGERGTTADHLPVATSSEPDGRAALVLGPGAADVLQRYGASNPPAVPADGGPATPLPSTVATVAPC